MLNTLSRLPIWLHYTGIQQGATPTLYTGPGVTPLGLAMEGAGCKQVFHQEK